MLPDFPLRPIENDEQLDEAVRVIDVLVDKEELTEEEDAYVKELLSFVESYEEEHHPIDTDDLTPVEKDLIDGLDGYVEGLKQENQNGRK